MLSQKVHFLTYLVKNELDLTNPIESAVVAIPTNAEVTHISLTIDEPSEAGYKADIGYSEDTDALSSDIDLSQSGSNILNKIYTTKAVEEVVVTIKKPTGVDTHSAQGKATLRVMYYLPSTTTIEI